MADAVINSPSILHRLSRILSTPAGAESTGLHAVDGVNSFSYIMSNFHHPGDWESPLHDAVQPIPGLVENAAFNGRRSAAVGYLMIEDQVWSGRHDNAKHRGRDDN